MDPKVIEMNNLRVLHDYLNQTLDVLMRGQRFGASHTPGLGYSPFTAPIAGSPGAIGTDVIYGPGAWGFGASPLFNGISPFPATNPFTGLPQVQGYGPSAYGPSAYGHTAYSPFGSWGAQPWQQSPWTSGQTSWPVAEAARQAQLNQALAAKQSVLEQMCRVAGIQF